MGIGLGGFMERQHQLKHPFNLMDDDYIQHAHSTFLEIGASGGILAFVFLMSIFILYGYGATLGASTLNLGALLYWAGQGVSLSVDTRIYVSWLAITLAWFAALAFGLGRPPQQ